MFFSEYTASVTHLGTADSGLEAATMDGTKDFWVHLGFPILCVDS